MVKAQKINSTKQIEAYGLAFNKTMANRGAIDANNLNHIRESLLELSEIPDSGPCKFLGA